MQWIYLKKDGWWLGDIKNFSHNIFVKVNFSEAIFELWPCLEYKHDFLYNCLAPVVQRVNNTIHRISHQPVDSVVGSSTLIHWTGIDPVDSIIQLLNNQGPIQQPE